MPFFFLPVFSHPSTFLIILTRFYEKFSPYPEN